MSGPPPGIACLGNNTAVKLTDCGLKKPCNGVALLFLFWPLFWLPCVGRQSSAQQLLGGMGPVSPKSFFFKISWNSGFVVEFSNILRASQPSMPPSQVHQPACCFLCFETQHCFFDLPDPGTDGYTPPDLENKIWKMTKREKKADYDQAWQGRESTYKFTFQCNEF